MWSIKGALGHISKTFNVEMGIESKELDHQRKAWTISGEGDGLKINGTLSVSQISVAQSRIALELDIDTGKGIVAVVIDNFLKNSLAHDTEEAEIKIRAYVEEKSV